MEKLRQSIAILYKKKTGEEICPLYLDEVVDDVLYWVITPSVLQQAVMKSPLWLSLTGDDARTV